MASAPRRRACQSKSSTSAAGATGATGAAGATGADDDDDETEAADDETDTDDDETDTDDDFTTQCRWTGQLVKRGFHEIKEIGVAYDADDHDIVPMHGVVTGRTVERRTGDDLYEVKLMKINPTHFFKEDLDECELKAALVKPDEFKPHMKPWCRKMKRHEKPRDDNGQPLKGVRFVFESLSTSLTTESFDEAKAHWNIKGGENALIKQMLGVFEDLLSKDPTERERERERIANLSREATAKTTPRKRKSETNAPPSSKIAKPTREPTRAPSRECQKAKARMHLREYLRWHIESQKL